MKFVKKIKYKSSSLNTMLPLLLRNKFCKEEREMDPCINTHISLTSYGSRIQTVFFTIESIMQQESRFSSITLYLSEQDIKPEKLPNSLQRLTNRGLRIVFVKENLMSYKKIWHAYNELLEANNMDASIVTADDDIMYDSDWLTGLLEQAKQHKDMVITHRAKYIAMSECGNLKPYKQWSPNHSAQLDLCENTLLFPLGVSGVLYPMKSLDGFNHQNRDFMKLCSHADDVWLKCLTLSNGYKVHRTGKGIMYTNIISLCTKRKGLAVYNVHQGGNDIQMEKTLTYFRQNKNEQLLIPSL